ncbi:MAG: hypothetical protein RLZZ382_2127 [Bacteroidota bacterium]|jgi:hypothetical protein
MCVKLYLLTLSLALSLHALSLTITKQITLKQLSDLSHTADSIIRTTGYFSVHPNAAYGTFQVILNDKELIGNAILLVKDANGKESLKRTVEVKPGINFFSLNDPKFAQGNYFISVINGNKSSVELKGVLGP